MLLLLPISLLSIYSSGTGHGRRPVLRCAAMLFFVTAFFYFHFVKGWRTWSWQNWQARKKNRCVEGLWWRLIKRGGVVENKWLNRRIDPLVASLGLFKPPAASNVLSYNPEYNATWVLRGHQMLRQTEENGNTHKRRNFFSFSLFFLTFKELSFIHLFIEYLCNCMNEWMNDFFLLCSCVFVTCKQNPLCSSRPGG